MEICMSNENNTVGLIEVGKAVKDFFCEPVTITATVCGIFGGILELCGPIMPEQLEKFSKFGCFICLMGFLSLIIYKIICIAIKHNKQREDIVRTLGKLNTKINENKLSGGVCVPTYEKEERCHQVIINKLDERSHFQYITEEVTLELKKQLSINHKISKLQIICYGRSGYDDVMQHISRLNRKIHVEVIMYNAEKNVENNTIIHRDDDRSQIDRHIKSLKERNRDVKIYLSDIPPMIRACALYEDDTAVWTTIQSYQLQCKEYEVELDGKKMKMGRLDLYRPDDSLIIICDEKSSKKDFDGVVQYFRNEFKRLKKGSKEAILTSRGKVEYQDRIDEK